MSEPVKLRSYGWLFWALACFGLAADLGSKYAVNAWLDQGKNHIEVGGLEHRGYAIIPRMFSLVRQEGLNKGALFGMGNDPEHGYKANWVFAGVSTLAAIGIIIWSFRPTVRGSWVLSIALGLILAGALGNLFDRVVMGGVRDFIWVYYQSAEDGLLKFNFPVFNIADSCLCVGAAILLLQTFFTPAPKKNQAPAPATTTTH
jgi:lipoprotein signal peptidase